MSCEGIRYIFRMSSWQGQQRSFEPEAAPPESGPPAPRPETHQQDARKQEDNDDHLCNPDISLSRIRGIVGGEHSTGNDETAHVRTEPPHHEPK
jgi:hypothetical protein